MPSIGEMLLAHLSCTSCGRRQEWSQLQKSVYRLPEVSTRPTGHRPDRNVEGVLRNADVLDWQLMCSTLRLPDFQPTTNLEFWHVSVTTNQPRTCIGADTAGARLF